MATDFYSLCRSLLQAIDAGNPDAEESVLCRIREAVREAEKLRTLGSLLTEDGLLYANTGDGLVLVGTDVDDDFFQDGGNIEEVVVAT